MYNKDVERSIKHAVEHCTPDVLDGILSKCGEQQSNVYILQPKKQKWAWVRAASALAAVFVLLFGGVFTYRHISNGRIDALVMLDVNPSLEISINKNEKVLSVDAKNADAVKILDNMDLRDTHINVAVNALVGSMLKYGYIKENANSVLLSVEGTDHEKSVLLQRNLAQSISQQLNTANGAVISQTLSKDDELQLLAQEHQISYGKAALVQKIIDENSHLLFADLAQLSVNELNLLVGSKRVTAENMEANGSASDADYIGEERARQLALAHAGIAETETTHLHVEMDYDDGTMVYDVEFNHNGREYEYEIGAKDGVIIEHSEEGVDDEDRRETPRTTSPPQAAGEFIGEDAAIQIALGHASLQSYTGMKVELDKDDGLYIYEVEFDANGMEYSFDINAVTGEIISWETDD